MRKYFTKKNNTVAVKSSDTSITSQPRRLLRVQSGLSANYAHKGEYDTALEHYEKARQVSLTYLPSNRCDLASLYKNIGDCYLNQDNYCHALQHYEQAISLIDSSIQSPKPRIITELRSLIDKTKQLIKNNK